ncbi:lytic transglycosylase domain-containing protein [Actinomadura sp. WAC 06369]|uniref:aggregation-promoting factor C-terminal-like domain-containing protein n=1 Tax=Actinomadura sp. WAC 06369 TaxID=2203193 RepID=UPI001F15D37D|nr:lytic transglycosylase domain-containing protein [Actinomadura sp. WAC 06369]
MSGDRPGSPRRDERQHPRPLPHEEDVRVAGPSPAAEPGTAGGAPGGDTLGLAAVPGDPERPADPNDTAWDLPVAEPPAAAPRRTGGRGGRRRAAGKGSARRNGLRAAAIAAGAAVVVGGGTVAAFALTGDGETTVGPARPLADAAPTPTIDPKVLEKLRHEKALERAAQQVRQDGGEKLELQAVGKPLPTKKPTPTKSPAKRDDDDGGGGGSTAKVTDPVPAGEAQQIAKAMLPDFGFSGDGQFGCLVKLWDKESSWNVHADNPYSDAYGIPQANPGSKMASAGPDWQNNARTQIKWGLGYIKDRYDTPCGAWNNFLDNGSY